MIGQQIKAMREKRGMTQAELATILGLTRGQISMYEIDRREPDVDTLHKLAAFFQVTMDDMTGFVDRGAPEGSLFGGGSSPSRARHAPGDEDEPPLTPDELDAIERIKRDPEMGVAFQDFLKAPIRKQRSMLRALQILGEMDEK